MKTINTFITEKLKVSNKAVSGPTVGDFICWFYRLSDISEFTFKVFEITDFDPASLDEDFGGDIKAQYEYIMEHINDPIGEITITNPYGDFDHEFAIGNVPFIVTCDEEFIQKKY